MLKKYLLSLGVVVLLISAVCTTMRFATRSQVPSGQSMEETWQLEFTLEADREHTYQIGPELQKALEQGITFVAEGPVRNGCQARFAPIVNGGIYVACIF